MSNPKRALSDKDYAVGCKNMVRMDIETLFEDLLYAAVIHSIEFKRPDRFNMLCDALAGKRAMQKIYKRLIIAVCAWTIDPNAFRVIDGTGMNKPKMAELSDPANVGYYEKVIEAFYFRLDNKVAVAKPFDELGFKATSFANFCLRGLKNGVELTADDFNLAMASAQRKAAELRQKEAGNVIPITQAKADEADSTGSEEPPVTQEAQAAAG